MQIYCSYIACKDKLSLISLRDLLKAKETRLHRLQTMSYSRLARIAKIDREKMSAVYKFCSSRADRFRMV